MLRALSYADFTPENWGDARICFSISARQSIVWFSGFWSFLSAVVCVTHFFPQVRRRVCGISSGKWASSLICSRDAWIWLSLRQMISSFSYPIKLTEPRPCVFSLFFDRWWKNVSTASSGFSCNHESESPRHSKVSIFSHSCHSNEWLAICGLSKPLFLAKSWRIETSAGCVYSTGVCLQAISSVDSPKIMIPNLSFFILLFLKDKTIILIFLFYIFLASWTAIENSKIHQSRDFNIFFTGISVYRNFSLPIGFSSIISLSNDEIFCVFFAFLRQENL